MTDYTVVRSKRRSMAVEITRDARVIVRVPLGCSEKAAAAFAESQRDWIEKHLEMQKKRIERYPEPDEQEKARLIADAKRVIPERVRHYAGLMGLEPAGIKITGAKARFGSCSAKNGLCFSWRLMLRPPEAVDCVVVHELAHIKHKNHGRAFYALMASVLPDYKERQKLL